VSAPRQDAEASRQEFTAGTLPAVAVGGLDLAEGSREYAWIVSVDVADDPVLSPRLRPAPDLRRPNGLVRWTTFWPGEPSPFSPMVRLDMRFTTSRPGQVRVLFEDTRSWRERLVPALYASLIVVVEAQAIDLDAFIDAPMKELRPRLLKAPHLVLSTPVERDHLLTILEWSR
jgi:hypothetical protein